MAQSFSQQNNPIHMADYELKIDFVADSGKPTRIFRSMAGLIDAFERFDADILASLDLRVSSGLLLHDVERGSLKACLRRLLQFPDQEALRDGDWNKLIGRMLDNARLFFITKLEECPVIDSKAQLEVIQTGLAEIAASAPLGLIHVPRPIELPRILSTVKTLEASSSILIEGDSISYESETTTKVISREISVARMLEEQLLSPVSTLHPTRIPLPIKKPDLIGDSQWDLYMGDKIISVRILDADWLSDFHTGNVELRPGDALDADLEITVQHSAKGEIVGSKFEVKRVYGITRHRPPVQLTLPGASDAQ